MRFYKDIKNLFWNLFYTFVYDIWHIIFLLSLFFLSKIDFTYLKTKFTKSLQNLPWVLCFQQKSSFYFQSWLPPYPVKKGKLDILPKLISDTVISNISFPLVSFFSKNRNARLTEAPSEAFLPQFALRSFGFQSIGKKYKQTSE